MARIPDAELEHMKSEISVERLVEAAGIALTKSSKDRLGKCPFHEDHEASLVVTPARNLWHCFGCGAAGGPIDWVMRMQGVSFRHAVELLRADLPLPAAATPAKESAIRRLPPAVALDADDQALLRQVVDYYHATLKASPEALDYLKARGIHDPEAIERFKLGFANRTLGYSLPIKAVKAGGEIRGRLAKIGLYRESGHEHFTGSIVFPIQDEAGNVTELYGRKICDNLRKGTPYHLYLPGPHRGVWNLDGLMASKEVILCEALIDALTFWCAGFRNVTAAYGVEGFTPDHLEAFQRLGVERVLIAYDRDEAGDRAAEKLAKKLMERGMGCWRALFPKGMDANAYALKVHPAKNALGLVLQSAEWMGGDTPPEPGPTEEEGKAAKEERHQEDQPAQASQDPASVPSLAAAPQESAHATIPPEAVTKPLSPVDNLPHEIQGQDLLLTLGDRRYRVRGWQKPLSPEVLRVNLMVSRGERFHVDTLDLYQAKARAAFLRQAGIELGESEDRLKLDLGKVLRKLEALQEDQLALALAAKNQPPPLTEAEHTEAMALLEAPDLLDRILRDFDALGIVGEEPNKLTGYLAAVSRLLDRPLALLIQSASAAGKSSLMDAVLDLIPEEDVIRYSAMSGQSLFYMGDRALRHKVLAIAEEEGARQASYALKLLQSEGKVTMASTGKDPGSGMLVTHDYMVEGPVMLFLTTTAIDLDEELLNRCLVLTVNESREQTRLIHAVQRSRETLEGLLAKNERDRLLKLHRNAQRLLQSLTVVNPYADQLSFRDDQTRSRRDHVKYLTLIRSIALLHQFQRDVKTHGEFRYIEVIPSDIERANALAQEILGRTVDELLPQTRKLLTLLHAWVKTECERQGLSQADFTFTRRQAREAMGWGDTQLWTHLGRLVEMEFLLPHRGRGKTQEYELLYQEEEGRTRLLGLAAMTAQIRGQAPKIRGGEAENSGSIRGVFGPDSGGIRDLVIAVGANGDEGPGRIKASEGENRSNFLPLAAVPSYPKLAHVNGHGR